MCKRIIDLPVVPLRSTEPDLTDKNLVESLVEIASSESIYHDGFHILSLDWKLMAVSQYFSPPIAFTAKINRTKIFGGRYLAALFGSTLPTVALCGIASTTFGLAVFKDGEEVLFEGPHV